jgi:hypothetical protein
MNRKYGPKTRTMQEKRTALTMMLTLCRSLDGVSVEGLVRCYGVKEPETAAMLAAERERRSSKKP